MREPSLLVLGTPRSGTTMACSALTTENRKVFIEEYAWRPAFFRKHARELQTLDEWGAKEVRHDKITELVKAYPDAQRLWCIRNPIDAACSLAAFSQDHLPRGDYGRAVLERVTKSAAVIADLAKHGGVFLFYEYLGRGAMKYAEEKIAPWTFNGNPSAALASRPTRQAEAERHAGQITHQPQSPHRDRLSLDDKAWVWANTERYRERFGYLTDTEIEGP